MSEKTLDRKGNMSDALLDVKKLSTYFKLENNVLVKAVENVSFQVKRGKVLGIIGESGSGKSVTAMSILQLFEENQKIHEGTITFEGKLISELSQAELRKIRGNKISVIF